MRLKQLESLLEDVEPFREPNNELEQYPTGAHLAACVLAEAHARGDVEGRVVADLGVGGGVLAIASLLAGARRVVGVDVDPGALELCRDNCDAFEPALRPTLRLGSIPEDVARWNADPRAVAAADEADEEDEERDDAGSSSSESEDLAAVEKEGREEEGRDDPSSLPSGRDGGPLRADTVVMNPPFGTRARGVDVRFLRCALGVARTAVYSLHKSSTRAYLERHALHVLRATSATVLAELRYELPRVYAHHRKDSVTIEVDLWRFEPPADGVVGGGGEGAEGAEGAESAEDSSADMDVSVEERQRRARIELRYAGERNRFGDGGIGLDRHPGRGGRPGTGGKGARAAEAAGRGGRGGGGRGGGGRRGRGGGGRRGRGGGGGAPRVVIR